MKKIISALAVLISLAAGPAQSNTFATDMSDLWWNPNESGWGVTINHQGEILFITFFVYGEDGKGTWYGAPNVPFASSTAGGATYSGQLYQTNGPWQGGAFDSRNVTARSVGNVTFTSTSPSTATLAYTVDGVQITKSIERQTWRVNSMGGTYRGAMASTNSCLSSGPFPPDSGQATNFSISNSVSSFSMTTGDGSQTCTYTGNYTQAGRMGRSAGAYNCNNGVTGTYVATEIEANAFSIAGRAEVKVAACVIDSTFSAIKN